ncbi:MAG: hypothetical protein EHM58_15420 [Ignavibacteriae bacterium]|nr:MAG: hypothetical protein EHM58_15420 [Ignavibacteriota bacterium]
MIKRALYLFLLAAFVFSGITYSQLKLNVKVSASNLLRYGNGKENTITTSNTKEYFEELGDVRLFVNDFLFGVRYEYDAPIEFGTSVKGISRRFIEYKKEDFTVRAGNFYDLYERGLVLNAFENRGLGFNTQLDGLRLNFKRNWNKVQFNGTIMGGDLEYNDYLNPGRVEKYTIRSGNFSFSPLRLFTIGGSYLTATGNIPSGTISTDIKAELFEATLGFNYKSIDLYGTYANKKTITLPNTLFTQPLTPRGDGAFASLTFTRPSLGVTIDYKNYRFNLTTPNERSATNPTKTLPFQNPPTGVKEYTWTLLTRYPHITDFNDEVGFQVDAFYSPKDNLSLNLNLSLSSRHYDYVDSNPGILVKYERVDRTDNFIPSTNDAFSPYWEAYLEAEYYYKKNTKIKIAVARQSSVLYAIENPAASDKIRTVTIPLEIMHDFKKVYSVKLMAEQQWVYNSARTFNANEDLRKFSNHFFSLSISRSPDIIVNGNFEFSTDEEDASGKKKWASAEVTYKFSSANSISLFYGTERGGLKCSSGICRYVNPFNGFRLTVINNFN